MKQKLAFMASLGYARMEPEEVCQSLAKLGYDGVEWTMNHFNPRTKTEKELKNLVRITKENGLEVSEVVVQQDVICLDEKEREDRINLVIECIQAAAKTGVSILNLFTGPAPWNPFAPRVGKEITEGKAWQMVYNAYDQFVKEAEENKVNLAVEGVWGMLCHDYYTTKLLIEHYDSEYLGVNLDPSHDTLYGNYDIGWIVKQWGDKIKHIHLKDAVGIPEMGKFIFPLLGEGNVDWKEFFTALDEINYQGFMSVEFESFTYYEKILKGDINKAAEISMEQVKELQKLSSNR